MRKGFMTLALVALTAPALAQDESDVKFKPGDYGAMVNGSIIGDGYVDYRLGAKAGQELYVELVVESSSGNGTVYFNVLPPGSSGEAIYNSSIEGNTTTVDLPRSGTYAIRVYHMGNDEDSGAKSRFRMDLSIQ